MMQSFAMMAVVTVVWAIVGYSLAFGAGNSFIGGLQHMLSARRRRGAGCRTTPAPFPQQTFMVYQLMFAIITPALIMRRVRRAHEVQRDVLFMVLWLLMVYCPMAHMVWGKGGLLNACAGRASFPASISPAARWCTSPRASRRWCARFTGQARWLSARNRCRRTAWC